MIELDEDAAIAAIALRPKSLTVDRANSFLPTTEVDEEWQKREDAGENVDGILGMCGCIESVWPDERPTVEEARWILSLEDYGTWRWIGSVVLNDWNQISAMQILDVSRRVLACGKD